MIHENRIKYKEKSFWIYEGFLELLSQYICETFEFLGLDNFNQNLQEIYDDCDVNRSGAYMGMVNISFDDYITNSIDRNTLIQIFKQTKIRVQSLGEEITIEKLNQFEHNKVHPYFYSSWVKPIKTKDLVKTLDAMIQLLQGTYAHDNEGIDYEGFGI